MNKKKRKYKRIYKTWGIHTEQTVRFHQDTRLYEIRESNRLINIHEEELDSLIINLLQIRERTK